jgi:hypothetical protein
LEHWEGNVQADSVDWRLDVSKDGRVGWTTLSTMGMRRRGDGK